MAAVIQAADGNLYGTTMQGGPNNDGTVFRLTPAGALTTLHAFTGAGFPADGAAPRAGLLQAKDGNFYGTTMQGGTGHGTVFHLDSTGALSLLHSFTGDDGEYPEAALIQATDGNFYGTTYQEGTTVTARSLN